MSETKVDVSTTTDDANENHKRSERKRQREKQRRSDLTSAFEELSELILKIEPSVLPVEQGKKKKKSSDGAKDTLGSGMTRLDVVARTVEVVKALYDENERNKRMLEETKQQQQQRPGGSGGQRDEKVLVMVPTLTLMDDPPSLSSSTSAGGIGMPPSQQTPSSYGHPRYSNYPHLYPQGPPFGPPSNTFAPPYFPPPPQQPHHQHHQGQWDSGDSPLPSSMESRGSGSNSSSLYPPPISSTRESNQSHRHHHHQQVPHHHSSYPQHNNHHPLPAQFYDYPDYSRRSDSRNSDEHSQTSDRSLEPEEL